MLSCNIIFLLMLSVTLARLEVIHETHFKIDHESGKLDIKATKEGANVVFAPDDVDLVIRPDTDADQGTRKSATSESREEGLSRPNNGSSSDEVDLSRASPSSQSDSLASDASLRPTINSAASNGTRAQFVKALSDIKLLVQKALAQKHEEKHLREILKNRVEYDETGGSTNVSAEAKELLQTVKEAGNTEDNLSSYIIRAKEILAYLAGKDRRVDRFHNHSHLAPEENVPDDKLKVTLRNNATTLRFATTELGIRPPNLTIADTSQLHVQELGHATSTSRASALQSGLYAKSPTQELIASQKVPKIVRENSSEAESQSPFKETTSGSQVNYVLRSVGGRRRIENQEDVRGT